MSSVNFSFFFQRCVVVLSGNHVAVVLSSMLSVFSKRVTVVKTLRI